MSAGPEGAALQAGAPPQGCATTTVNVGGDWRGAALSAVAGLADGDSVTAMVHFRGEAAPALPAAAGGRVITRGALIAPASGRARGEDIAGTVIRRAGAPDGGAVELSGPSGELPAALRGVVAARMSAGGLRALARGQGGEIAFVHVAPELGEGPCAPPDWR